MVLAGDADHSAVTPKLLRSFSRGPVNLSSSSYFMVMFRETPKPFPPILGLQSERRIKKRLSDAANAIIDQRWHIGCTSPVLTPHSHARKRRSICRNIIACVLHQPLARSLFPPLHKKRKIFFFIYILLCIDKIPPILTANSSGCTLHRWDPRGGWPRSWYIWFAFGTDRPAAFWPLETWLGPSIERGQALR